MEVVKLLPGIREDEIAPLQFCEIELIIGGCNVEFYDKKNYNGHTFRRYRLYYRSGINVYEHTIWDKTNPIAPRVSSRIIGEIENVEEVH